jgi:uncharacterized protein YqjF (DUF2071 family)
MRPADILQQSSHRPWPLPAGPWIMAQTWHDLLFAHWPVEPDTLRELVPPELPLDTYAGRAWVAVAPFHMSGIRARGLPPLPGLSRFPELNVRTYVTLKGKPGVFFFSLDVTSRAAVWAARTFYHLPYYPARMQVQLSGDKVDYCSQRLGHPAELRIVYWPTCTVRLRAPGIIEHWLTERYCLYTVAHGGVYRADIHHVQWPLQDAAAHIENNTMASTAGIALPGTVPLLHFAKRLEVLIWPLQRVR